jgi:hypothetical protein
MLRRAKQTKRQIIESLNRRLEEQSEAIDSKTGEKWVEKTGPPAFVTGLTALLNQSKKVTSLIQKAKTDCQGDWTGQGKGCNDTEYFKQIITEINKMRKHAILTHRKDNPNQTHPHQA